MAVFIPDDKIEATRNATDIVDVISEAVVLKKTGKNFIGLCPFHNEKTPSFTVSPDKQIYYCFGCGAGGNVFSFVMKMNGTTFPDTVRALASRSGIDIPSGRISLQEKKRLSEKEQLAGINHDAMNFYCNSLKGGNSESYLVGRGMTQKLTKDFKLGYAPSGWRNLTQYFERKKTPLGLVEKAGLIVRQKTGNGYYDRFRDRIIFPIFDTARQVIGFGGRVMDDSLPKYLNSPETPLYNKSRSLYGIHRARNNCRQSGLVYLVEGYFDLLSLHQYGIENAVATLGTSLTGDHVRVLKGCVGESGKAILVYDSDAAGIKAAQRSVDVFQKGFMNAEILVLPKGHDPDSFLMEFGPGDFLKASKKALGLIPFLIESAIEKHGLSIDGKIKIVSDLKGVIGSIRDSVARSLYVKKLSERTGVDESIVLEKIRSVYHNRSLPGQASNFFRDNFKETHETERQQYLHKDHAMERKIISMVLQFPEMIPDIRERDILDLFRDKTLKTIGSIIVEKNTDANMDIAELINCFDDSIKRDIVAHLSVSDEYWDRKGCQRLIAQFESGRARLQGGLLKQIEAAEKEGDTALLAKLLMKKQKLAKGFLKN